MSRATLQQQETAAHRRLLLRGDTTRWANASTQCFVTGRNEWVEGDGWPTRTDAVRELYLASEGSANTRRGDGSLTETTVISGATDEIVYNPAVPVEFQSNFRSFAASEWSLGLDQGHLTARDEAIVYTSAPLAEPLTAWGRPTVTITVQCSTVDADLYILLSDVFPLGSRDLHLSHAAMRLAALPDFTPKEPLAITLEMDEIAHDFLAGHSVRLTVVPSLFPAYARNLHQKDYLNATSPVLSTITVLHGAANKGSLRLPVVK